MHVHVLSRMTFVLDTTSDEYNQQVSSDKEIDFDKAADVYFIVYDHMDIWLLFMVHVFKTIHLQELRTLKRNIHNYSVLFSNTCNIS